MTLSQDTPKAPHEAGPNFILVSEPEPAVEALRLLTWETPSTEITPDMTPELSRLMNRMFLEF